MEIAVLTPLAMTEAHATTLAAQTMPWGPTQLKRTVSPRT